ncbi:MAG: helix-turn-helix domain-containing protein [Alphaproteobacteria bacterium]|nr:helix-turn-helix domain-containing protein [Marinicaulis sp.]NOX93541.1 helix-turn-helix domain-containing protein [Alphaproteobacteria bacterium]
MEIVARNRAPISLKLIAERANVAPSKAHRYVQSLCVCEFLKQAHKSGSYDLGIGALRIGMAAVNRIDVVNRAGDELSNLGEQLNADVFLSVWSALGPTVVRCERSRNPSLSMIGPGVAFPLFTSATGLIFAAYSAPELLHDAVQHEIEENSELHERRASEVASKYQHAKEKGYVYTSGTLLQGRECVAAPIFSIDDRIIAAVTYVAKCTDADLPDEKRVKLLLDFCRSFSLSKSGYCEQPQSISPIAS